MDMSGIGSLSTNNLANLEATKTSKLEKNLSTDYANATDQELMDVCKQFEAYFLEQVFKEMKKTVPKSDSASDANSSLVDYFQDNTIQDLAAQSTETNSLGIAQALYEQMKRNYSL